MSEVIDVVYVLLCTYTSRVFLAFSRTPNVFISRVSLNRARSDSFSQPLLGSPFDVPLIERFGICEPRETTCASSSSSATSAGRVPHPWSLRAPRGTRELEFHDAPRPLASRGPRVPALRRGAFPDPRRTPRSFPSDANPEETRAFFFHAKTRSRTLDRSHPFPPASRPRPPPRPPRSRACTSRNAGSRPPWCPSARRTRAPGKMSSRWRPGF